MTILYQVGMALIFHIIDIVSGLIGAIKNHDLRSDKMRDGMFKKVGFIFCYLVAIVIDKYGNYVGINLSFSILPVIIAYAVATELVSILENITKINPDLKIGKLKDLFQVKGEEDDKKPK